MKVESCPLFEFFAVLLKSDSTAWDLVCFFLNLFGRLLREWKLRFLSAKALRIMNACCVLSSERYAEFGARGKVRPLTLAHLA